ncbi:hypothetical protein AMTR_s00065p00024470 [Amborella trichopoda]|uniref:Uncharacterized protein n=1 Tax=Amborella trichopoda TaxID=13333 RepID=U5D7R3_AMBTC|nr:hypothetical protein AMTR_s00065p00024470 [Amborella trichopoda]
MRLIQHNLSSWLGDPRLVQSFQAWITTAGTGIFMKSHPAKVVRSNLFVTERKGEKSHLNHCRSTENPISSDQARISKNSKKKVLSLVVFTVHNEGREGAKL